MKCPTCFAHLQTQAEKLVCVGSCDPTLQQQASAVRGHKVELKTVFDAPPASGPDALPSGACPKCQTTSSQEVCGYCFGAVPAYWRLSKITCIAMAGARATGKSLLLAVAKPQLEVLLARHYSSDLSGIGNSDDLFYRNYTQTLYEERLLIPPTPSASQEQTTVREPMMFQFTERRPGGATRSRIVVFRDVAGEDLEKLGGMDQSLGFYSRADGVVAMFDPLTVSGVRNLLSGVVPADTVVGGDGLKVLRHVVGLMTAGGAPGTRTPIPLAVVLSKVDALQRLSQVPNNKWSRIMGRAGSPLQRDPSMRSVAFNYDDGDLLHAEVAGLLEELGASTLSTSLADRVDLFRYFGTSALGAIPKGKDVPPSGIAPYRALDPFKWILDVTAA